MKNISIKYGKIVNGKFESYNELTIKTDINEAKNIEYSMRQEAHDKIAPIYALANDHYVVSGEIYSVRGKLKEVHIIRDNNYLSDEEFEEFIKPYSYIGAFHR